MTELTTQNTGITIEEQIGQALKKMPYTEATIAKLKSEYMTLKTNGVDDKAAYEAVHAALMTMVKVRTSIELSRKALKADALTFGRAVDTEAERLTKLAKPTEQYLLEQRDIVDKEMDRIKAEKDAQEQARLQGRVAKLLSFGMSFDGNIYRRGDIYLVAILLKSMSEEAFEVKLAEVEADYTAEQERKAEEERQGAIKAEEERAKKEIEEKAEKERKAEEDRLRAEKDKELTVERERLEKIAKEQTEKAAEIKAAQDKIDAEKKSIEDQKRKEEEEKKRQEEIEKARLEAASQAIKDEQARVEREAKEKEEREKQEAIEAEEKKAQMSDKDKLKDLLIIIDDIPIPEFKSKKAKATGIRVNSLLQEICKFIREGL